MVNLYSNPKQNPEAQIVWAVFALIVGYVLIFNVIPGLDRTPKPYYYTWPSEDFWVASFPILMAICVPLGLWFNWGPAIPIFAVLSVVFPAELYTYTTWVVAFVIAISFDWICFSSLPSAKPDSPQSPS